MKFHAYILSSLTGFDGALCAALLLEKY